MTPACYFHHAVNTSFHDLTHGNILPAAATKLLGLGLKFIPSPKFTTPASILNESFERLELEIGRRCHFAGDITNDDYDPSSASRCRIKSAWRPPLPPNEVCSRLSKFETALSREFFKRRGTPNLTPHLKSVLQQIASNDNIVIANSDKGLGPCGLDLPTYIKLALVHLTDKETYEIITEQQALEDITNLEQEIFRWTVEHRPTVGNAATTFIRKKLDDTRDDPFGYFYVMPKLHKEGPLTTRPVCSDCGSLTHALGKWVDEQLQPIVQAQPFYFKNSSALKKDLDLLNLPPNASVLSYDATSMYQNIPPELAINTISGYLYLPATRKRFPHYHPKALLSAIEIVMRNNRMRFGDIIVKQIKGISMGMSPSPSIANLFVAIHEERKVLPFLKTPWLKYLKRFIDDGFAIWIHDADTTVDMERWTAFVEAVNDGGLEWIFTPRSQSVVFMDMTIRIVKGRIETALYAKPLALYLYLPPHSCHAPGVLTGLIYGQVLRIYQLCSQDDDKEKELVLFVHRLLDRGYQLNFIIPILTKAIDNAIKYLSQSDEYRHKMKKKKRNADRRSALLHLPFNTDDPKSSRIQDLWRDIASEPPGKTPLNQLETSTEVPVPIDRLIICYHRSPNLGNQLSYRKIDKRQGPKVSSYL